MENECYGNGRFPVMVHGIMENSDNYGKSIVDKTRNSLFFLISHRFFDRLVDFLIGLLSLSEDNQSCVIEAFNSTSRYLDDLLNIDNNFFDSMVNRIYPSELQLNKANVSDAEASFFGFTSIYIGWFCEN